MGPKSIPKTVVFAGESEQAMLHSSQHRSDTGGDLDHRTLYRPVQNQMYLLGAKAIHRRISYHFCSKSIPKLNRYLKKDRVHPLELLEEEKAQRDIRLTVKMRMVNDNQNGSLRGLR